MKDFRPISLCNVIYKIVAKCLANRLRPRLITDNALIAFECVHAIQKSHSEQNNFCANKMDLTKAYDRVDWDFLRETMNKMGFQS